ncbi:MAG: hypothetical protein ACFB13_03265 [Kiloniellaceae bacterium]
MQKYLPYLVVSGLIVLAVYIVVTRPGPPGLSDADLADIRARAAGIVPEDAHAQIEEWAAKSRSELPKELSLGRVLFAFDIDGLTINESIRLAADESAVDVVTLGKYLDAATAEVCQNPKFRLLLEAGVVFMTKYETADGSYLRYYRLSKDNCRTAGG